MKRRNWTLWVAIATAIWAVPALAAPEVDADELRRIKNVAVDFQVERDLSEECVGSVTALRDLVKLIVTTSRIPVLKDAADATHIVTWKFRSQVVGASDGGAVASCETIGELDVRRTDADDASVSKIVAFESSFHTDEGTKRQIRSAVRTSVSRNTSTFVREVLKAQQAGE